MITITVALWDGNRAADPPTVRLQVELVPGVPWRYEFEDSWYAVEITPPAPGSGEPTSDPATWVPVPPNTAMAAAAALRLVADRYRRHGGFTSDAEACDEIADRLERALVRWSSPSP